MPTRLNLSDSGVRVRGDGPYDGVIILRPGGSSAAAAPLPGGPLFDDGDYCIPGVETYPPDPEIEMLQGAEVIYKGTDYPKYESVEYPDYESAGYPQFTPLLLRDERTRRRLTSEYIHVVCTGRRTHPQKTLAALYPTANLEPHYGGFLRDMHFGRAARGGREERPARGRHGTGIKWRFRCARCGRDVQMIPEKLEQVYAGLCAARDAGNPAAVGEGGSVRLDVSALPF